MDVQITAGKFKGKKLRIPEFATDFRPTKQMVREALCSALQMETVGANVLELCAGSGVFSLEMLSRGANHATIVESSFERVALIRQAVEELQLSSNTTIIACDVEKAIASFSSKFDIIFFDPPYKDDRLTALIPNVSDLLSPFGTLVFECATDDLFALDLEVQGFQCRSKKYGQTSLRYFRKKE